MITTLYTLFLKSKGVSTDTRKIIKKSLFFALKGEKYNANKFALEALKKGASYAVVDEKKYQTDKRIILVNNVLKALQSLATHHRKELDISIISLTGSNGKTTTKELIDAVLTTTFNTTATKGNLNNHIGVPLTLLSMTKQTEIGVVEFGANHSKEIAFLCNITKPNYGYITNFGKAHLEGFGSLEGVINAKTELYTYLKENKQTVFININDTVQVERSKGIKKIITFGQKTATYTIEFVDANPFVIIKVNNIIITTKLIGSYNFSNIAIAITIGLHFKINIETIKNALENYTPNNNRSQIIDLKSNKIILDAYNANPTSMQCAIDNFDTIKDTRKMAILGDMFELGDYAKTEHQNIVDLVNKSTIDKIYLLGENFHKTIINSDKIQKFKTFTAFESEFKKLKITNISILIKASRGMALERVLDLI
ncbi:MAG: UDP-N-acetylmuramoyl-tripeptide--D-alanyl-D-alanine ligase [Flavobacteriaceae bacterium]|nr:UDP-N-acetylmuramoyl-tripeptide--D-alanyl-D-alanine ligase [Flavobacteriaceae bacterium]